MTNYITITEAASVLHIPFYRAKQAISTPNMFPEPDVHIAGKDGWHPDRIVAFGQETGLLDTHGKPTNNRRTWKTPISVKWKKEKRHYLGQDGVGKIFNIKGLTVYIRHHKGEFLKPDIYLGRRPGWDEEAIRRYAAQLGKTQ